MKNVLTIAGSDSCGCAGIQADLKTMGALGVFGMSALTAVTVQNTIGVRAFQEMSPGIVSGQIDAIFDDIRVDAVKIGMVANAAVARAIRESMAKHQPANLVVDPVMVSKTGSQLFSDDVKEEIMELSRCAVLTTPNLHEAELMSGVTIRSRDDMPVAARAIRDRGVTGVLVKGGRLVDVADDFLLLHDQETWFNGPRIETKNTNGTGCSLSAAIACFLANGLGISQALYQAKCYVTRAIRLSHDIGHGAGPLGHFAAMEKV